VNPASFRFCKHYPLDMLHVCDGMIDFEASRFFEPSPDYQRIKAMYADALFEATIHGESKPFRAPNHTMRGPISAKDFTV
jgi:hypothetical protein